MLEIKTQNSQYKKFWIYRIKFVGSMHVSLFEQFQDRTMMRGVSVTVLVLALAFLWSTQTEARSYSSYWISPRRTDYVLDHKFYNYLGTLIYPKFISNSLIV